MLGRVELDHTFLHMTKVNLISEFLPWLNVSRISDQNSISFFFVSILEKRHPHRNIQLRHSGYGLHIVSRKKLMRATQANPYCQY